jgi:hypothetical protein
MTSLARVWIGLPVALSGLLGAALGVTGCMMVDTDYMQAGAEQQSSQKPPAVSVMECDGEEEAVLPFKADWLEASSVGCSRPSDLFCATFDELPVPDEWALLSDGVLHKVSPCAGHNGKGAMHISGHSAGYAQVKTGLREVVVDGTLHARFYLYVSSKMVLPTYAVLFELWDGNSFKNKRAITMKQEGQLEVVLREDTNGIAPYVATSEPGIVVRDQWMCVQWRLDVSDTAGGFGLSVDGRELLSGSGLDTLPPGNIQMAVLGTSLPADTTLVDFYLDDLVLSREPVPCQ